MTIIQNQLVGLDFETYSDININEHGLDRYISSPYFQPILARTYTEGPGHSVTGSYQLWDPEKYQEEHARLSLALRGKQVAVHNVGFEAAVLDWMDIPRTSFQFVD